MGASGNHLLPTLSYRRGTPQLRVPSGKGRGGESASPFIRSLTHRWGDVIHSRSHSLVEGLRVGLVSWIQVLDLVAGFPGNRKRTLSSETLSARPPSLPSWSPMPATPSAPPLPEHGPLAGGAGRYADGRDGVSRSLSERCPPVGVEARGPSGLVRRPTASRCVRLGGGFMSLGLSFPTM